MGAGCGLHRSSRAKVADFDEVGITVRVTRPSTSTQASGDFEDLSVGTNGPTSPDQSPSSRIRRSLRSGTSGSSGVHSGGSGEATPEQDVASPSNPVDSVGRRPSRASSGRSYVSGASDGSHGAPKLPCPVQRQGSTASENHLSPGGTSRRRSNSEVSGTSSEPLSPGLMGVFQKMTRRKSNASNVTAATEGDDTSPRPVDSSPRACEDFGTLVSKALRGSGCLVLQTVRMRALQAPETLASAHGMQLKPDPNMPSFDSKVDSGNLLDQLANTPLRPDLLALQRVSFMSTDWLAIRLLKGTKAQCLQFCLCVAVLRNVGKSVSRSVVVEVSANQDVHGYGYACAPVGDRWTDRKKPITVTPPWVDHAEDIVELAHLILNETCLPHKKAATELKKWCQRPRSPRAGARLDPAGEARRSLTISGGRSPRDGGGGALPPADLPSGFAGGRRRSASDPLALDTGREKGTTSKFGRLLSLKSVFGTTEEQSFSSLATSDAAPARQQSRLGAPQGGALVNLQAGTRGAPLHQGRVRRQSLPGGGQQMSQSRALPPAAVNTANRRRSAPDAIALLNEGASPRRRPSRGEDSSPRRSRGEARHASQPGSLRPPPLLSGEAPERSPSRAPALSIHGDGTSSAPLSSSEDQRPEPRNLPSMADRICTPKKGASTKKRSLSSERQRHLSRSLNEFHMPSLLEESLLETSDDKDSDSGSTAEDASRRTPAQAPAQAPPRRRHSTGF